MEANAVTSPSSSAPQPQAAAVTGQAFVRLAWPALGAPSACRTEGSTSGCRCPGVRRSRCNLCHTNQIEYLVRQLTEPLDDIGTRITCVRQGRPLASGF